MWRVRGGHDRSVGNRFVVLAYSQAGLGCEFRSVFAAPVDASVRVHLFRWGAAEVRKVCRGKLVGWRLSIKDAHSYVLNVLLMFDLFERAVKASLRDSESLKEAFTTLPAGRP